MFKIKLMYLLYRVSSDTGSRFMRTFVFDTICNITAGTTRRVHPRHFQKLYV